MRLFTAFTTSAIVTMLTLVTMSALIVAPVPATAATPLTNLPAVESQVMCVTCKIPLTVAQSPQADRERAFIQELIGEGKSEAQIKQALVAQYGPQVLALPATHGFSLAAYLVPIAVVAFVLGLLVLLLPRWRRRARTQPALAGGIAGEGDAQTDMSRDRAISPADAARLEADLARFD
jgi:cytochrome c-type biogenesis protein CcmH